MITAEDDQRIVQTMMERPLSSAVDITQELGLPCNPETTRRHLNECWFPRCCIPAKKEKLTLANKESRLEFTRHYSLDVYNENFWNSVIWTDQKSFQTATTKSYLLATSEHQVCCTKHTITAKKWTLYCEFPWLDVVWGTRRFDTDR